MNNEKAKNAKRRDEKVEIMCEHSANIFLRSVWKIHEVATRKGAQS